MAYCADVYVDGKSYSTETRSRKWTPGVITVSPFGFHQPWMYAWVQTVFDTRVKPYLDPNLRVVFEPMIMSPGDFRTSRKVTISFAFDAPMYCAIGTDANSISHSMATCNCPFLDAPSHFTHNGSTVPVPDHPHSAPNNSNGEAIVHCFMHILGHEHQTSGHEPLSAQALDMMYRLPPFRWTSDVVAENILKKYTAKKPHGALQGLSYDNESILRVFYPAVLTTTGAGIPMNRGLSPQDINLLSSCSQAEVQPRALLQATDSFNDRALSTVPQPVPLLGQPVAQPPVPVPMAAAPGMFPPQPMVAPGMYMPQPPVTVPMHITMQSVPQVQPNQYSAPHAAAPTQVYYMPPPPPPAQPIYMPVPVPAQQPQSNSDVEEFVGTLVNEMLARKYNLHR